VITDETTVDDVAAVFGETAVYPSEYAGVYLRTGLLSEVGEMANVIKKVVRGDASIDEYRPRIYDEFGDVVWYAVMLSEEKGAPLHMTLGELVEAVTFDDSEHEAFGRAPYLAAATQVLARDLLTPTVSALRAVAEFSVVLGTVFGEEGNALSLAAQSVAEKLRSRAERGVIQGDGDHR